MTLQLALFDIPGPTGTLLVDWSARAIRCAFSTNEHGCRDLQAEIDLPLHECWRWYEIGLNTCATLISNGGTVWEGRIEDVAITARGLKFVALGYWRAFSDGPYNAVWSDQDLKLWRALTPTDVATALPDKWQIEKASQGSDRLYLAPRKGETFGAATAIGYLGYEPPDRTTRNIVTVTYTYSFTASASWTAKLQTRDSSWGTAVDVWTLVGNGATQTGTTTVSGLNAVRLSFALVFTAANAAYTGDTGDYNLKITGIRVKTTSSSAVYADEVAGSLLANTNVLNTNVLSSDTTLIQSPAIDMLQEVYEDADRSALLTRYAALGDGTTPWEVGVAVGRYLYLRPRGYAGRTWYVDATALEIEQTMTALANQVYGTYRSASGRTLRTATSSTAASQTRYGLTRRIKVDAQTTDATQAAAVVAATLADHDDPAPRATVQFERVWTASGGLARLWEVAAGDTIVIRNLPPTVSTAIDRLRTMRIAETVYDCIADTLKVTPESPPPTIDVLLARQKAGV